MKTRKAGPIGRFGARYGAVVKERFKAIELKQRRKQRCPFCKKLGAKRLAKGLWRCRACGKKFASQAYYLEEKA